MILGESILSGEIIPQIFALLIPIVAIVMVFGTGMLAIYFNFRKRREMFALYHQERMAAIEKGVEIPPLPDDFFQEDGKGRSRGRAGHGTLLGGLILSFLGLALYLAVHYTVPPPRGDVALFAIIPISIGLACLVYYFAVGRKLALVLEAERAAGVDKAKGLSGN